VRILITGVTGQVGSALMRTLHPYGELVPADRTVLDLAQPKGLAARLDALQPDAIINPAAYTAVDRAEDERDLAFVVNCESPGVIARWAADRQTPLIHFSTDYVYDGSGTRPWREDDHSGPLSVYGASKLAGEQAIHAAGGARLIVRTSWVYAAEGTNFLRTIARLAGEREELRIVADQIGAPTSATWIAEAISQIFERNRSGLGVGVAFERVGHTLNMTAAGETSWHGFATAIVNGLKRRGVPLKARSVVPIETKDYPTKAMRPKNSRLDLSRLNELFGTGPESWETLLNRELDRFVALRGT
jgi:dTDP-4-dehydrorhamnose reductase